MESWLRWEWAQAGLPKPLVNPSIYDDEGRFLGRIDLFDEQAALAGEYEGDHHRERAAFRHDVGRGRGLGDENIIVVRVTGFDLPRGDALHRSLRAHWKRGMARDRRLDRWQLDSVPFRSRSWIDDAG